MSDGSLWQNVNRQLKVQRAANRMTVLIREEDRIDRELPGLRAAERMCHELFYCIRVAREYDTDKSILTKRVVDLGLTGAKEEDIEKQIALILPTSDNPPHPAQPAPKPWPAPKPVARKYPVSAAGQGCRPSKRIWIPGRPQSGLQSFRTSARLRAG